MKSINKRNVLFSILVLLSALILLLMPQLAFADVMSDLANGQENANTAAINVIAIAMVLGIGLGFGLLIPEKTRKIGWGLIVGLGFVVFIVLLAKNTSIGSTVADISNATDVREILKNK